MLMNYRHVLNIDFQLIIGVYSSLAFVKIIQFIFFALFKLLIFFDNFFYHLISTISFLLSFISFPIFQFSQSFKIRVWILPAIEFHVLTQTRLTSNWRKNEEGKLSSLWNLAITRLWENERIFMKMWVENVISCDVAWLFVFVVLSMRTLFSLFTIEKSRKTRRKCQ